MTNNYFSQFSDGTNTYYARAKAPGESSTLSKGRDNALISTTSLGTYSPILSFKTTNGSWELGSNSTDTNSLIFSYISDTNYTAGTDTAETQLKLTKSGALTLDGSIHINSQYRGLYVLDDSNTEFAMVAHNGTNLWFGAYQGASYHHTGATFISTGYDTTNSIGYSTFRVSIPNATNDGATTEYGFHTGYLDVSKATAGTLSIARGGTGSSSVAINKVFAGPGSGSAGAPSFRSLVAADIPNISAAKITSGILSASYGGTGNTSLNASANALINSLTTGASTPSDDDYYVSQYAGGGITTTTYHRRPMSALANYTNKIKSWSGYNSLAVNTVTIQDNRTAVMVYNKKDGKAMISIVIKINTESTATNANTQLTNDNSFPDPVEISCFPAVTSNGSYSAVLYINANGALCTGTKLQGSQSYYGAVTYIANITDTQWNNLSNA